MELNEIRLFDLFLVAKDSEARKEIMNKWIERYDSKSPIETAMHRFTLALESFRLSYDI